MAPMAHGQTTCRNLTSDYFSILQYHPIMARQSPGPGAQFCLGENPEYKSFDLCYSFKTLVQTEYGRLRQLHDAVWNYQNNRLSILGDRRDAWMSYEKEHWNLVVFMFGHDINAFESVGAQQGHRAILALECFTVADQLGRFHWWYKQVD